MIVPLEVIWDCLWVNFVRAKSETGKTLKQSVNQRILDQPGVVAPDALSQRIAFIWLSKCIPQLYGIPEAEANSEYFDIEPSPEADRQARVLTIPPIPADFKAKLKAELRQELVVRKSQSFATIGRAQSENFCNRDSQVVGPSVLAKRERVPESVSVSVQSVPPEEPKLKRQRISRETTLVVEEELPQSDNNFDQGPPEPVNPPDNETQPTSSVEDEPLSLPEENPSTNETNVFSTPNFPVKVVKPLGRSLTTGVHSILSDQVKTTLDVQLTEANIEKMNSLQKMVMRVHKEIEDLKNAIQKSEKESYDQSFQLRQELLQLKQTLGDTLSDAASQPEETKEQNEKSAQEKKDTLDRLQSWERGRLTRIVPRSQSIPVVRRTEPPEIPPYVKPTIS